MPRWLLVSLTLIAAGPASAEPSAQDVLGAHASANNEYFQGLVDGISWANAAASKSGAPIYCPPDELVITTGQYATILRTKIAKEPRLATYWASFAMLSALKTAFPCPSKP